MPGVPAARLVAVVAVLAGSLPCQHPAPSGEPAALRELLHGGTRALDQEDPVLAWRCFREALASAPQYSDCLLGLGRAHLLLGRSSAARAYAEAVLALAGGNVEAMALAVRAAIRARQFDAAVVIAARYTGTAEAASAELLAAQASALFRVQRTDEAAAVYRQVLVLDAEHAEAHLRLGSGLLPPQAVELGPAVHDAVAALRQGNVDLAIASLQAALRADPNAVVHRLLGEALFQRRAQLGMASQDPSFQQLGALLWPRRPPAAAGPAADFVPGYAALSPQRAAVVDRALATFGRRLDKLLAIGGRHDLLLETDRTTDAAPRAGLRGRRTFDGRVWDDVRGIGGLQAATGIEALDEASQFGFDTFVHELAHQVHYYALPPRERARIRALYQAAKTAGRCLDYYAASNEAEYFGQGVEAFVSLAKRPGGETTHGHTRFELYRVDRELHDFIAGIVDVDPLADAAAAAPLLRAACAVALRCGRPADAAVAAALLPDGPERARLLAVAAAALRDGTCY